MCRILCLPCELCASVCGAVNECLCGICACISECILTVLRVCCLPCKCMVDCIYKRETQVTLLGAEHRV
jgi:hypothetical protein